MNSILDEFNKIKNWDYYKRGKEYTLNVIKDWSIEKNHINFIEEYLKISGKLGVIEHFDIELKNFERATHTNSVFFLGCLFYEKLALKNKIKFYINKVYKNEFYFVWFLTSFVHDFGYKIEDDTSSYLKIDDTIESLKNIIKDKREINNLLKYKTSENKFLNDAYNSFKENTKTIIDYIPSYYTRRFNGEIGRSKGSKIDHGIVAGYLLYDSLVKIREERENQKENENLYWGEELEKFYAIASFSIAIHNMRRENIVKNSTELKFNLKNEPFLFLFGLADTLEPTKLFHEHTAECVLNNILIDFQTNAIIIHNAPKLILDFTILQKKAKGLESWLDVEVCVKKENTIVINIK